MNSKYSIVLLVILSLTSSIPTYAGIDWSRYDDGPTLFLGWETSFMFAIAAVSLLFVSKFISSFSDDQGHVDGGLGCFLVIINITMIICAICSFYLLVPLGMIYIILRGKKK